MTIKELKNNYIITMEKLLSEPFFCAEFAKVFAYNSALGFERCVYLFFQNKEAKNVLTIPEWNTLNRYIKRGSKAIQMLEYNTDRHIKITNYFDESQTNQALFKYNIYKKDDVFSKKDIEFIKKVLRNALQNYNAKDDYFDLFIPDDLINIVLETGEIYGEMLSKNLYMLLKDEFDRSVIYQSLDNQGAIIDGIKSFIKINYTVAVCYRLGVEIESDLTENDFKYCLLFDNFKQLKVVYQAITKCIAYTLDELEIAAKTNEEMAFDIVPKDEKSLEQKSNDYVENYKIVDKKVNTNTHLLEEKGAIND